VLLVRLGWQINLVQAVLRAGPDWQVHLTPFLPVLSECLMAQIPCEPQEGGPRRAGLFCMRWTTKEIREQFRVLHG
jgi:hypothetical protein